MHFSSSIVRGSASIIALRFGSSVVGATVHPLQSDLGTYTVAEIYRHRIMAICNEKRDCVRAGHQHILQVFTIRRGNFAIAVELQGVPIPRLLLLIGRHMNPEGKGGDNLRLFRPFLIE